MPRTFGYKNFDFCAGSYKPSSKGSLRLRLKEISHFKCPQRNANSSQTRISLLYALKTCPQNGINSSNCTINNNSGPGINSPSSHQDPGFRGPTVLVPLPTDD